MKKKIIATFMAVMFLTTWFAGSFSVAYAENKIGEAAPIAESEAPAEVTAINAEAKLNEENIADGAVSNDIVSDAASDAVIDKVLRGLKEPSETLPMIGGVLDELIDFLIAIGLVDGVVKPSEFQRTQEKLNMLIVSTARIESAQKIAENASFNELASQLQVFTESKLSAIKNVTNYQIQLAEKIKELNAQNAELQTAQSELTALEQADADAQPANSHSQAVAAEETTVAPEQKAVPEKASAVPEKAPAVPEKAPAVPQKAPAVPEKAPAVPEKAPAVPEKASVVPEKAPAVQANSLYTDAQKRVEKLKADIAVSEKEILELETDIKEGNQSIVNALKEPVGGNTFETSTVLMGDYISDKAVSAKTNPFVNYYEWNLRKGMFSVDADKLSAVYEQSIVNIYARCMVIDLYAHQAQYKNVTTRNQKKEVAATIEKRTEKYNKCLTYYGKMLSERKTDKQRYYFADGTVIKLAGIGGATLKRGTFFANSSTKNQKVINAMQQYDSEYADVYEYMTKIQKMIDKEFTAKLQQEMSLRQFLQSKGFEVPAQAKYLALEAAYHKNFSVATCIKSYNLDRASDDLSKLAVQAHDYIISTMGFNPRYNDNEFCYFYDEPSSVKATGGADLLVGSSVTHYDDIAEAWNVATATAKSLGGNGNACVRLQENWVATPRTNSNMTSFGTGVGFVNGAIGGMATLDLNGYTVDRNLKVPVDGGSVIVATGLRIINSKRSEKLGVITGGNTTGQGGGIYVKESGGIFVSPGIKVSFCIIQGNKAQKEGGGIYSNPGSSETTVLSSVQVIYNTSGSYGGGIYQGCLGKAVNVILRGEIIVENNSGKYGRNNYCLGANGTRTALIGTDKEIPLTNNSVIYVSNDCEHKWNWITNYADRNYTSNFRSDLSRYVIKNDGSGDSQCVWYDKR